MQCMFIGCLIAVVNLHAWITSWSTTAKWVITRNESLQELTTVLPTAVGKTWRGVNRQSVLESRKSTYAELETDSASWSVSGRNSGEAVWDLVNDWQLSQVRPWVAGHTVCDSFMFIFIRHTTFSYYCAAFPSFYLTVSLSIRSNSRMRMRFRK